MRLFSAYENLAAQYQDATEELCVPLNSVPLTLTCALLNTLFLITTNFTNKRIICALDTASVSHKSAS